PGIFLSPRPLFRLFTGLFPRLLDILLPRLVPVRATGVEPALDDGQALRNRLEVAPSVSAMPVESRDRLLRHHDLLVYDLDEGTHDGREVRDLPLVVQIVGELVAPVGEDAVRGDGPVVPAEWPAERLARVGEDLGTDADFLQRPADLLVHVAS